MALNVIKPIADRDYISLLLPTRGRPEMLKRSLESIDATAGDKARIDVWIYVDEDDEVTRRELDAGLGKQFDYEVHWVIGGRCRTLGEILNRLREACTTNPGIYSPATDDYLFIQPGWDEEVRRTFTDTPDRVLLAYPSDALAATEQVTFPLLSAEWTNALGCFCVEYFPFWYVDTWLDEVATMAGRKQKLNFAMDSQAGKGRTQRMRNVVFWQAFFDETLDERIADARRLLEVIHGKSIPDQEWQRAQTAAEGFRKISRERNVDELVAMEAAYSEERKELLPPAKYMAVELEAAGILYKKMAAAMEAGDETRAEGLWSAIQKSTLCERVKLGSRPWEEMPQGKPRGRSLTKRILERLGK